MGREPDLYHRGGQPLWFGLSAIQGMQCRLEDRRIRPMARQIKPDTARVPSDDRGKLQQLISQGMNLRIRQGRVLERQRPQPLHQGIGQCREQNAELVGIEILAAGAGGKQTQLRFLDAILCFTARAVELIVHWFASRSAMAILVTTKRVLLPCSPNSSRATQRRAAFHVRAP
jgi:hypothetical protein